MRTRTSKARLAIVHPWMWWATFEVARRSGSGVVASFRAAQKATASLNA